MKQKILSLIIILMVGTQPLFPFEWEEDTLTKEVDFSEEVDNVEQEGAAWCVYASMEAVDGMEQCTHCFNYIHSFLVGKDDNVYGSSYIPDEEYKAAMKMFNEESNSTCTSKETFSKFGVAGGDNRFFESEGYNNVSSTIFVKQLMDPNEYISSPVLLLKADGEFGHCIVFVSSQYYNKDWYDPSSSITIMDPSDGHIHDISWDDLMSYDAVYSK